MGYYSKYAIDFGDIDVDEEEQYCHLLNRYINGYHIEPCDRCLNDIKWYEWKTDICKFTEDYPYITVYVERVGEEAGDYEKAVFRGGRCLAENGQISYRPFDMSLLPALKEKPNQTLIKRLKNGDTVSTQEIIEALENKDVL